MSITAKSKFGIVVKEMNMGKTLARALLSASLNRLFSEDAELSKSAKILEIGGQPASHQRYMPPAWQLTLSNYKMLAGVDLIIDAEKEFPSDIGEFDGVVCFNALYIIKDYFNCFSESLKLAKKFVIFNIPLIQALVPEPNDFTRLTEDRINDLIEELMKSHKIAGARIIPVGGSFSAAVSLIDPYLKFRVLRLPFYLSAVALDKLDSKIGRRSPIMYLVVIKKSYEQ